ncbi:MAG TPA: PTS sugar transporter subunit IIA [Xanthobacteraceae bacterium]|nr:PTS sugar transporter subunit IIA [Xanthobacteraceae bacterium]
MKIADFLAPANVKIDVASNDKKKLLSELARNVGVELDMTSDGIAAALLKREALGSTGVGGGVAIPHARFQHAKTPFGMLARLKKPIDYDAVDGKPVDIVFLLLLPEGAGGEQQLSALASIARKLRTPAVTAALRCARDSMDMYRILTSD